MRKYVDDKSPQSIEILYEKCAHYFSSQHKIKKIWCVDREPYSPPKAQNNLIDVVFFGGFIQRFLESSYIWVHPQYRLWVLSPAVKKIFTKQFHIPDRHINLIPRYQLFPLPKKARTFPKIHEKFTLVYSGRISRVKNIETLLFSTSLLQTRFNLNVDLVLFGHFD